MEVMVQAAGLSTKLSKHLNTVALLAVVPIPAFQQANAELVQSIPAAASGFTSMIGTAVSQATSMGQELVTRIMSAKAVSSFDSSVPSVISGMCSFIDNIVSGEWVSGCINRGNNALDALVVDPDAAFYIPNGLPADITTPAELSKFLAQGVSGDTLNNLVAYQTGMKGAVAAIAECTNSSGAVSTRAFDSLHLASGLESRLGTIIAGVAKVLGTGADVLTAFGPCLDAAESVVPGIKEACGFNLASDLMGQNASTGGMVRSAKQAAASRFQFAQQMEDCAQYWI